MTSKLPSNPYVSVSNDLLTINCSNKTLQFPTPEIEKIYLKKNSNYWHRLVGQVLSAPSNIYDLHIETSEGRGVCITVNALERFYFVRLIADLRDKKRILGMKKAKQPHYFVSVA